MAGFATESPRMRLARLALDTARATPGVAAPNPGREGRLVTGDRREVLPGVVVTAEPAGRYSVDLYLTAELVPLEPLGVEVEGRLRRAAEAAGLSPALGEVHVSVLDVREPGLGTVARC